MQEGGTQNGATHLFWDRHQHREKNKDKRKHNIN